MANAIKKISVQRGYDVTRYALNCFGGAGGQHACLVADALGMTTRADPSASRRCCRPTAWASPTSAPRASRRSSCRSAARPRGDLDSVGDDARQAANDEVAGQGVAAGKIKVFVRAHIRYAGTDTRAAWSAAGSAAPR